MASASFDLPTTPNLAGTARSMGRRVMLSGRCSVEGGDDVACVATEIAMDRLIVRCDAGVSTDDKTIFSFPEFGLLEAVVTEALEDGFVACFPPSADSKLGVFLAWLEGTAEPAPSPADQRDEERLVPIHKLTTLKTAGEPENMARIIDLSRSSAAFTTSKNLETGEPIALGAREGHVVRLFEGGAAVAFDRQIGESDFHPLIDLRQAAD